MVHDSEATASKHHNQRLARPAAGSRPGPGAPVPDSGRRDSAARPIFGL